MTNKKDYMLGWERVPIGLLLIFITIILGYLIINLDSRIDELEKNNSTEINDNRICYSEQCYIDVKNNIQVGGCTMSEVNCKLFENKFASVSGDEQ